MAFKGSYLQGDEFISPDVLKQLIDNDNYLYKVSPTIALRYPSGTNYSAGLHSTRQGDAMKVTSGSFVLPSFKGYREKSVTLPAYKKPGPPIVLLSVRTSKGAPAIANIVGMNDNAFNVRVQVLGGATAKSITVYWAVIHAVPDN